MNKLILTIILSFILSSAGLLKTESESGFYTCYYYSLVKTEDNPYGEFQPYRNCIFIDNNCELKFTKEHFKNVDFTEDSIANIHIIGFGSAYVNKQGKVVLMHTFDNGADYFHEGLARSIKDGKLGYVNRALETVIPPQYDAAYPFKDGKAKVGINCNKVQADEHFFWDCKEWFYIDKNGNRL